MSCVCCVHHDPSGVRETSPPPALEVYLELVLTSARATVPNIEVLRPRKHTASGHMCRIVVVGELGRGSEDRPELGLLPVQSQVSEDTPNVYV